MEGRGKVSVAHGYMNRCVGIVSFTLFIAIGLWVADSLLTDL